MSYLWMGCCRLLIVNLNVRLFVLLAVRTYIVIMEIQNDIIICDTTKQRSVYIRQIMPDIALRMASTACLLTATTMSENRSMT